MPGQRSSGLKVLLYILYDLDIVAPVVLALVVVLGIYGKILKQYDVTHIRW